MARLPAALVAAGVAVAALAPTVHGAPPANDDWGNAPGLSAPDTTLATNVDATLEPGDNYWSDWTWRGIVGDVWFKWTASVTGWAAFKTTNPDYEGQPNVDTIAAVFTGNAVNALTRVAANDDYAHDNRLSLMSRVAFKATAGTTYSIGIANYPYDRDGDPQPVSTQGDFDLTWGDSTLYDTMKPTVRLGSVKAVKGGFTATFTASDDTAFVPGWLTTSCRIDAGPATPCSSPWSPVNVPAGTHTLSIVAVDGAGNQSAPATATVRISGAKK
jgi:hypothetical protein